MKWPPAPWACGVVLRVRAWLELSQLILLPSWPEDFACLEPLGVKDGGGGARRKGVEGSINKQYRSQGMVLRNTTPGPVVRADDLLAK